MREGREGKADDGEFVGSSDKEVLRCLGQSCEGVSVVFRGT